MLRPSTRGELVMEGEWFLLGILGGLIVGIPIGGYLAVRLGA